MICPETPSQLSARHRWGYGLLFALCGLLQIVLVALEDVITKSLLPGDGTAANVAWVDTRAKLGMWMGFVLLAAAVNLGVWRYRPPPPLGAVSMRAVHEAEGYSPCCAGKRSRDAA